MINIITVTNAVYLGVALVITLRTLAVFSEHFVSESNPLSWFRFYKTPFARTLGAVGFFLAISAFFHGSLAWTLGNLVFGFAAYTNFEKDKDRLLYRVPRNIAQSFYGSKLLFVVAPLSLFAILCVVFYYNGGQTESWTGISGAPFEFVGAYFLAIGFLSMKLNVWQRGDKGSHESWQYLLVAPLWDALLLTGAILDGKAPFILLEGYAIVLDCVVLYLVKFRAQEE